MPDPTRPLHHHDLEGTSDEDLRRTARAHLAKAPHLQLIAELLGKLRSLGLPWWTPEFARTTWPANARMRWLIQRSDVRQHITTSLTGLAANAARKKSPDFQADLIDSVIDDGDLPVERFEAAFDPCDLVVYGPAFEVWAQFRDRMPWEEDSAVHQRLMAWTIKALLSDRSGIEGVTRRPVLTPCDIRAAIDARVWQSRVPLEVRVAVDEARLRHERARPREPFQARHELSIATPEVLAANIPLSELSPIIAAAERAMGYETAPESTSVPGDFLDEMTPANNSGNTNLPVSSIRLQRMTA